MAIDKIQFTLRLNPVVYEKIKVIAKDENRSTANMLEYLIKIYIKKYENKHGEIHLKDVWENFQY